MELVAFFKYSIFKEAFIRSRYRVIKLVSKYLVKIREQGDNDPL